ncbi:PEP-CTERM sorting domain-containing protein [Desulfogranum japonicum]|uniref:PEP-CTERM sorting domain-containing protein n=1 Tax=Desulfogranum japonicum TaxID=231447 RepID=UPI0004246510|nr:PEP-CTERM sorting domain-containing protein [Desulfogranum japonicum]
MYTTKNIARIAALVVAGVTVFASAASACSTSYTAPTHSDASWQEIDGIYWSVDNGVTWGNDELTKGQEVIFKIDVHKDNAGSHYADLAKIWVDWGNDGSFDEPSDTVLFGLQPVASGETDFSFISNAFLLDDSLNSTLDLLARVTCTASVYPGYHNLGDYFQGDSARYDALFLPTGSLWQGEAETYQLIINDVNIPPASGTPTPEPGTMFLFAAGLAGLAAASRKSRK